MAKIVMLCGLPASGKSTLTQKYKENGYTIHSSDAIREELTGSIGEQKANEQVFTLLHSRIKDDLMNGKNTVYDACNINYKRRMEFLKQLDKIKDVYKECIFMATPYEICLKNNAERDRTVPEHVIKRMYENFYIPQKYEGWDSIDIHYFNGASIMYYNFNAMMERLRTIEQDNPHHTLTIGKHCDKCHEELSLLLIKKGNKSTMKRFINLDLASRIHDIGKEFCKTYNEEKGHSTYYQHHLVSAYNSIFVDTMPMSTDNLLEVANYIQWHMKPFEVRDSKKAEQNFIQMVGQAFYDNLLLLHEADLLAK